MARTVQQMLDDNDAAIAEAEKAQAFTVRGRMLQRASLDSLYRERDRLMRLASVSGQMASVAIQGRVK